MITANEARIQQSGNNLEMIDKNLKEIEDRIKIAIRGSDKTTGVIHWINGMSNAVAVAAKVKEYGYAVNCVNSTDPRDGNLVAMQIQWG